MNRFAAILMAVLIALATPATAANPVKVIGDNFVIDEVKSEAVFTGNVVVTRPNLTVWAEKVVVLYGPGGSQDIKSFVATGAVRIKTEDQDATGDYAVFDPKTQILRLSGNVAVDNAAGTVTGPDLVVNLETNTSVFTGGSGGRVTGVFNTQ